MRPIRLMYGDIGNAEKLEKDWTLMLRLIVTDRMCSVATGTLLETTGRWGPASGQIEPLRPVIT